MSKAARLTIIVLAAGLSVASTARAGSIWAKAKIRARALTSDDTAWKVGDSLTIVIDERSVIENETNRTMQKKTDRTANTSGTLDLANVLWPVGKHIFDFPKLGLDSKSDNKFDGSANYDSDRSLLDEVAATVEDVLPNGNLVVIGTRTREVEGDKQTIQVSGIVRPSDITFDNTVNSEKVTDFRIVYKAKGREGRFTAPGWLARFLNTISPF